MDQLTFLAALLIVLVVFSLITKGKTTKNNSQDQITGGLDYVRSRYSSQISQAKGLCIGQFSGTWRDDSSTIGCFNMKGFSTAYCSMSIIQDLSKLCSSIGGRSVCTSTQASCSV